MKKNQSYSFKLILVMKNKNLASDKDQLIDFYHFCKKLDLDIIGTMCIPPNDGSVEEYFSEMNKINRELNFKELSMGMSGDYLEAIKYNATYVRVGSKIFGSRT